MFVELLVVIAIIATLVAISVGGYNKFRSAADQTAVMGSLRSLQLANTSYASDNNGAYVAVYGSSGNWQEIWCWKPEFVDALFGAGFYAKHEYKYPRSFLDPVVLKKKWPNTTGLNGSFGANTHQNPNGWFGKKDFTAQVRVSNVTNPGRTFSFTTAADWHVGYGGRTSWTPANQNSAKIAYRHGDKAQFVFFDGHVESLTRAEVNTRSPSQTAPFWNSLAD